MLATHTVVKSDTGYWSALNTGTYGRIAGKSPKPASVSAENWVQNVAVDDYPYQGFGMGYWIAGALEADPGLTIMIDELSGGHEVDVYNECQWLRVNKPHLNGRWGVYLVNGENVNYAVLNPAIDVCILTGAPFGCEFYYEDRLEEYLHLQDTFSTNYADDWARSHFNGPGRVNWLVARHNYLGVTEKKIFPMFGVIDRFTEAPGAYAAKWLDREMYNFRHCGYGGLMLNYGVGSWVWDSERVGTSSRDLAFATSLEWYVNTGNTSSHLGLV